MTRVGVARLKAELSEYLRKVKRGKEVIVYDRDTPIARIVPYEAAPARGRLVVRPPKTAGRIQDIPLPPPLRLKDGRSIVDILIEERQAERDRLL